MFWYSPKELKTLPWKASTIILVSLHQNQSLPPDFDSFPRLHHLPRQQQVDKKLSALIISILLFSN